MEAPAKCALIKTLHDSCIYFEFTRKPSIGILNFSFHSIVFLWINLIYPPWYLFPRKFFILVEKCTFLIKSKSNKIWGHKAIIIFIFTLEQKCNGIHSIWGLTSGSSQCKRTKNCTWVIIVRWRFSCRILASKSIWHIYFCVNFVWQNS